MENPIKDNRIVKDKTFALRLLGFALDTNCADACSEDEKESMISYSTTLLKYQIQTATDKDEADFQEMIAAMEDDKPYQIKKGNGYLFNGASLK